MLYTWKTWFDPSDPEVDLIIAGTLLNFTTLDEALSLSPLHLVEMIQEPSDEQGKQRTRA